jgi:hypothetical protein
MQYYFVLNRITLQRELQRGKYPCILELVVVEYFALKQLSIPMKLPPFVIPLQMITSSLHVEMSKEEGIKVPGIFSRSVGLPTCAHDLLIQTLQRQGAVSFGSVFLEDSVGIAESFHNLHNKISTHVIFFRPFAAIMQQFSLGLVYSNGPVSKYLLVISQGLKHI